jgi:hypothetical protein
MTNTCQGRTNEELTFPNISRELARPRAGHFFEMMQVSVNRCSNIDFGINLETKIAEYKPARERLIRPVLAVPGSLANGENRRSGRSRFSRFVCISHIPRLRSAFIFFSTFLILFNIELSQSFTDGAYAKSTPNC